jgi:TRAP transporter 4TM/12TM fusion protein
MDKVKKRRTKAKLRDLKGISGYMVSTAAVGMSVFQLYFSTFGIVDTITFRSVHLMFASFIIFATRPFGKNSPGNRLSWWDMLMVSLTLVCGVYIIVEWHEIVLRQGDPTNWDIYLGILAPLLVLELMRRTTGWALPLVCTGFLLYTYFGPYFPGQLAHLGFPVERMITALYTSTEGIYGLPLGVMTNYVFLFILFASFLHRSGAGDFFIQLSYAVSGRFRGGPAKTAVIASALMGSVSGSATANVVTTGSFTIPLMKRLGFNPETAGSIEVASSVGGQLLPPIMGAGAFIMSEWTGIPYFKIIAVASVPALSYYLSVFFYVHLLSLKLGIEPLPRKEIPQVWPVLKRGIHFLVPPIVLVYVLIRGYTPMLSAILAMVSMVLTSYLRKDTRMSPRDLLKCLETGARNAVMVTASMTGAGIIMCTVGLTGIGLKFSSLIMSLSGGNVLIALFMVALASLFLGMELPITAAYITCAVLAVPALSDLGLPLIVAHMVVFWFSMDSAITPPVCISAYAAAGISGGHPMKTGIGAWKMAKALYVMPVLMAYTKLITGDFWDAIIVAVPAVLGIFCINIVWEGFFLNQIKPYERLLALVAIPLLLYPNYYAYAAGLAVFALLSVSQIRAFRKAAASPVLNEAASVKSDVSG